MGASECSWALCDFGVNSLRHVLAGPSNSRSLLILFLSYHLLVSTIVRRPASKHLHGVCLMWGTLLVASGEVPSTEEP